MTFLEFLKWFIETPEGITLLTAKITAIVAAICYGVKSIRNAIISAVTDFKNVIKGKKGTKKEKTKGN